MQYINDLYCMSKTIKFSAQGNLFSSKVEPYGSATCAGSGVLVSVALTYGCMLQFPNVEQTWVSFGSIDEKGGQEQGTMNVALSKTFIKNFRGCSAVIMRLAALVASVFLYITFVGSLIGVQSCEILSVGTLSKHVQSRPCHLVSFPPLLATMFGRGQRRSHLVSSPE